MKRKLVGCLAGALAVAALSAFPAFALPASQTVAVVGTAQPTLNGPGGGRFPRFGFPDGYAPTFTFVDPAAIMNGAAADPLTGYDTVVMISCDIRTWIADPDFKSRVEAFVSAGGKLIMWDSECKSSVSDYDGFIYPFKTNFSGASGMRAGGLQDVEENTLSATDPASARYVDTAAIADDTDAGADSKVMVSFDSHWCVDLKATNLAGTAGPVQTYAHLGAGLIIYDGLDADYLSEPQEFDGPGGNEHLGRVWLFQLLQPFAPDTLPCDVKLFGITLTPKTASNPTGTSHTVTARVTSNATFQPGIVVTFRVTSGPNAGTTGTGVTDADGNASFTYSGMGGAGHDVIEATADLPAVAPPSPPKVVTVMDAASKDWVAPLSTPPPPTPDPCASDTTPPALTITSNQRKQLYRVGEKGSVRIAASDPGGLDQDPSVASRRISTRRPGRQVVTVTARDRCGNVATASFAYTVAAAPRIHVAGVPSDRCTASRFRTSIRISGLAGLRRVTVYLDGARLASSRKSPFRVRVPAHALEPGRHSLRVAARDRAGNRSVRTTHFVRCAAALPSFTG